jgi:hypothetical protein
MEETLTFYRLGATTSTNELLDSSRSAQEIESLFNELRRGQLPDAEC